MNRHGALPFLIDWLGSPHPTASLPHEASLTFLHLTHPDADLLRAVLAEVGSSDIVTVDSGPAGVHAEIRTPGGTIRL